MPKGQRKYRRNHYTIFGGYALTEKMCLYTGYTSSAVYNPHEFEWFLLLGLGQFFWGIKLSPETCAKAQEKHEFQMCHMNICHLYDPHPTTLATVTAHHTSILAPIEPYSISLVLSVAKISQIDIAFVFMAWIMQKLLYPHCKYIIHYKYNYMLCLISQLTFSQNSTIYEILWLSALLVQAESTTVLQWLGCEMKRGHSTTRFKIQSRYIWSWCLNCQPGVGRWSKKAKITSKS